MPPPSVTKNRFPLDPEYRSLPSFSRNVNPPSSGSRYAFYAIPKLAAVCFSVTLVNSARHRHIVTLDKMALFIITAMRTADFVFLRITIMSK